MAEDRDHIWTIRDGETAKAYNAFRTYMLQGSERSLDKTRQALGMASDSQLGNWSSKKVWNWQERVAAYDSYVTEAQVDGYAQQMASVRTYHMDITQRLLVHLDGNMALWKPGQDPSIRWTQALAVALKSQQQALQLREETDKPNGLMEQIINHLRKLEAE
jgi:hypothetical protein